MKGVDASSGLGIGVEAPLTLPGAIVPKAIHRDVNDARFDASHLFGTEVFARHGPGPIGLGKHVGGRERLFEPIYILCVGEIEVGPSFAMPGVGLGRHQVEDMRGTDL
jgi:hypothetical protein